MSVLVQRRREVAEQQIKELQAKREKIADGLANQQKAISAITNEADDPEFLYSLLENDWHNREREAVLLWLRSIGASNLPIKPAALTTAFDYPASLRILIDELTGKGYKRSVDPSRYWQGGKFSPVLVTDEEKEAIYQRAEFRVATQDDKEFYETVEQLVKLANRRNANGGEIKLRELSDGANVMYAGLIKMGKKGNHPLDVPQFEVDEAEFNPVKFDYKAFDEVPPKPVVIRVYA